MFKAQNDTNVTLGLEALPAQSEGHYLRHLLGAEFALQVLLSGEDAAAKCVSSLIEGCVCGKPFFQMSNTLKVK